MSKKLFFICCFTISSIAAFAQAPVDLFDPFYEDMTVWENIGLINDAPAIRPYPLQEIKRLLNIVIEKGDAGQRRRAEEYQARFFNRVFHYGGKTEIAAKFPPKAMEFTLAPFFGINYALHDLLTISGKISGHITNRNFSNSVLPAFQYAKTDIVHDSGKIGSFSVLPDFNMGAALGTSQYYFTGGIARTSYGPVHENSLMVGSHALHQGQFNLVINREKWTYNQTFLTLTATNDKKGDFDPHKFLAMHSLSIRPFPWLSFGMAESVVYGKRFEPIYLLPFSIFFVSQGLYNFPDNSLIGAFFTVKPVRGLRIDGVLYSDDIGFNEIVQFKKDAKMRMSGYFGISYTMPKTHWFSFIDLNYTFVMPYTYTHYGHHNSSEQNYNNYTHYGIPLGTNLEPNSDRIQLKLKFTPVYGLDVLLSNNFIRHGNITESVEDINMLKDYLSGNYTTDGSTSNHSATTEKYGEDESRAKNHAFLYSTPFMKQRTIQYVNQLGLDISCHLPIKKSGGYMLFKFGYVFEADINPGVGRNIYKPNATTKGWHEKKIGSGTDQVSENQIKTEAANQLTAWRKAAAGKNFNHYIKLSAEFAY